MTPAELRDLLTRLDWSAGQLAAALGCARTMPLSWLSGRARVPEPVGMWLRLRASAYEQLPAPPRDWRTRSVA